MPIVLQLSVSLPSRFLNKHSLIETILVSEVTKVRDPDAPDYSHAKSSVAEETKTKYSQTFQTGKHHIYIHSFNYSQ